MKKFVVLLTLILLSALSVNADTSEVINGKAIIEAQNKIDEIGFKLLNSNGIEHRMVFDFNTKNVKNAFSRDRDRQIVMYRGLYNRLNSDDEIAAVLSHEISHTVDSYDGIFRGYFSQLSYAFASKKFEYKADKKAVDYMVNAGYNPVAFIVVMSKTFTQERYDWYSSHPLSTKRMMEVYEYIYNKYPEYLVNNKYKNDLYYQNFLLTSKENRAKFQKKIESNSKGQVNYL